MSYYFETVVNAEFDDTVTHVTAWLAVHGFGVLSVIDVSATLKTKLGVDMRPYTILGACHPSFAHQALQAEPRIGTMLPCNVILRDVGDGRIEVAAVDPAASMQAIDNASLVEVANQVREQLQKVVADMSETK